MFLSASVNNELCMCTLLADNANEILGYALQAVPPMGGQ